MPTTSALAHGVRLTIGSDIAAGRSYQIPRALSYAFDNGLRSGIRLEASQLFWWGTRGAALALGLDQVGHLVTGAAADMVLHELPSWVDDAEASLAALIFDPDGTDPLRTWVAGREVWRRPADA
jgi:guanine deaminase